MQDVTRLFDILPHYAQSFKPKDDVLAGKDNGSMGKILNQRLHLSC